MKDTPKDADEVDDESPYVTEQNNVVNNRQEKADIASTDDTQVEIGWIVLAIAAVGMILLLVAIVRRRKHLTESNRS